MGFLVRLKDEGKLSTVTAAIAPLDVKLRRLWLEALDRYGRGKNDENVFYNMAIYLGREYVDSIPAESQAPLAELIRIVPLTPKGDMGTDADSLAIVSEFCDGSDPVVSDAQLLDEIIRLSHDEKKSAKRVPKLKDPTAPRKPRQKKAILPPPQTVVVPTIQPIPILGLVESLSKAELDQVIPVEEEIPIPPPPPPEAVEHEPAPELEEPSPVVVESVEPEAPIDIAAIAQEHPEIIRDEIDQEILARLHAIDEAQHPPAEEAPVQVPKPGPLTLGWLLQLLVDRNSNEIEAFCDVAQEADLLDGLRKIAKAMRRYDEIVRPGPS